MGESSEARSIEQAPGGGWKGCRSPSLICRRRPAAAWRLH